MRIAVLWLCCVYVGGTSSAQTHDWSTYGGVAQTRYSSLQQIMKLRAGNTL
jgi:hypothetical protein